MTTKAQFSHNITVTAADIDDLNHVNNAVYLQYIQDVATAHWYNQASVTLVENVVWVVRRHEIDYLKQAILGDVLTVSTWVGEHTAATWDRHVEIYRQANNQLIAKAKSIWVPLDRHTMRIKRIEGSLLDSFS
jgi:acyl-CoA thioester hydrolase